MKRAFFLSIFSLYCFVGYAHTADKKEEVKPLIVAVGKDLYGSALCFQSYVDSRAVVPIQNGQHSVNFRTVLIDTLNSHVIDAAGTARGGSSKPPYYDWDYEAALLLYPNCRLSIKIVSQYDKSTYLSQGRCFSYDKSGNLTSSTACENDNILYPYGPGIVIDYIPDVNLDSDIIDYFAADVGENRMSKIQLYPNPTRDLVYIIWEDDLRGKITIIEAVNAKGSNISNFQIKPQEKEVILDLGQYPPGMYRVKISFQDGQSISKTVIKY